MAYKIKMTRRAKVDLMQTANYLTEFVSPEKARDWKNGLFTAVKSLNKMPRRCPSAPDTVDADVEQEIRQLFYQSHRIVFSVDDEANIVSILRIYHTSREPLKPEDF